MAKSDFECKICKKVKGTSLLGATEKYQCPKHKTICGDHVATTWFSGYKCKECDNKVMRYQFNSKSGKWQKV